MSRAKQKKTKIATVCQHLIIFLLIFLWIFSGWPRIWPLGELGVNTFRLPPEIQEAQAAAAFRAAGLTVTGVGAITPAPDASHQTNDVELLFVETENEASTLTTAAGFVELTNVGIGVASAADAVRLTVFWRRWNGTDGNPTTNDSGDHQQGRIISYSGVITSGNPWDVYGTNSQATATTAGSVSAITTTVADTLIVVATAGSLPDAAAGTAEFSGWTNANLTSLTERADHTTNSGTGGSYGVADGVQAAAGSTGATTFTSVNSCTKASAHIALKPIPTPATDQNAFRWRNDNGSESTATWKDTENTAITGVSLSEIIRIRLEIEETNGGTTTVNSRLEFSSDATSCTTGTWTALDTSTTAWRVTASGNITNGDPTTNQLTSSALTFVASRIFDTQNEDTTGVSLTNQQSEWEWAIRGDGAANSTTYRFRVTDAGTALNAYTNCGQLTTAAPTVSCDADPVSTAFPTLTISDVYTSSPNASSTMTCTYSGGCTLFINDAGNGANPGLATSSPAYLIPSTTDLLQGGVEGYGIQATTTAVGGGATLNLAETYNKIGNNVGALATTTVEVASSTAAIDNREVLVTHKAAITVLTNAANYEDTITYSCTGN